MVIGHGRLGGMGRHRLKCLRSNLLNGATDSGGHGIGLVEHEQVCPGQLDDLRMGRDLGCLLHLRLVPGPLREW